MFDLFEVIKSITILVLVCSSIIGILYVALRVIDGVFGTVRQAVEDQVQSTKHGLQDSIEQAVERGIQKGIERVREQAQQHRQNTVDEQR